MISWGRSFSHEKYTPKRTEILQLLLWFSGWVREGAFGTKAAFPQILRLAPWQMGKIKL
jgi:hypothetical protein